MKKLAAILFCCLLSCLTAATTEAGGFAARNHSASGLGVANAMVAGVDDVSAAAYNPAALAWQDGIAAMVDMNVRYRNSSVDLGTAVGVAPNLSQVGNLTHLYFAWMPHESDLGVSLGFNRAYETDNDWSTTPFPTTVGRTSLSINRVTLDGIYRISSSLAMAAGGDWYISSATMTQGAQIFIGSDKSAFGGHLSMQWKPAPTWSLGLLARLGATVKMTDSSNRSLGVKLPDEVTLGVAKDVADSVRLELDADWSRWSRLKDLNVFSGTAVVQANTLDMKDALSAMAGITWFWRERSQIRFGYAYEQGANSKSAFNPVVADQTGHKIALGAGGDMFGVHGDFAYAYTLYPTQRAKGTFAGKYRDRRHSYSISITKEF